MSAIEYDTLVLEDAPRYYWKAEGNGIDSGTAKLDCTVNGITWPGTGLIPGSTNCAQTTTTSAFYRTTGDISIPSGLLTITYWCSHVTMGASSQWGYYGPGRFNNNPNRLIGGSRIVNGGAAWEGSVNQGTNTVVTDPVGTGDNQPHHIAIVLDLDHVRLHIDGAEVARTARTAVALPAATRFGLTLYPQSGLIMVPGKFERVAMHYDTALSPTRIAEYYQAGTISQPPITPYLTGAWGLIG